MYTCTCIFSCWILSQHACPQIPKSLLQWLLPCYWICPNLRKMAVPRSCMYTHKCRGYPVCLMSQHVRHDVIWSTACQTKVVDIPLILLPRHWGCNLSIPWGPLAVRWAINPWPRTPVSGMTFSPATLHGPHSVAMVPGAELAIARHSVSHNGHCVPFMFLERLELWQWLQPIGTCT